MDTTKVLPGTVAERIRSQVITVLSAKYDNGQFKLTVYAGRELTTLVVSPDFAMALAGMK